MRFAVSIINYRTADLTIACAQSALEGLGGEDGQVVIVDNASGDHSAERIADWIEGRPDAPVLLIRSPHNSGFSGGHNQGLAAADADLYVLLNSDAVLRPGFFAALRKAYEAVPDAGIFAPRLGDDDGTPQVSAFRFAGVPSEFMRGANTGWVRRVLRRHEVAIGIDPDPGEIEWVSFACVGLRRRMIDDIGPMDEGYFLYFEDAEYCLRARRAGWHIAWVPEAEAVHFRGGSGPVKALAKARKRMPAYYYASRTRFLYQAHGAAGLLAANLAWHSGRLLAQARRLFRKPVNPAFEAEARDLWVNFATPLQPGRDSGDRP